MHRMPAHRLRVAEFEALETRALMSAYVYHDTLSAFGIERLVAESSAPGAPEGVRYVGYGSAATGLGDLDADGFGDYAVAAPGTFVEDGLPTAGAVFVRSGRTGEVLLTLGDGAPGFGLTLLDMGDLDADGLHDLAIGSPRFGEQRVGRVWILSGATGEALTTFDGAATGDDFGWALARVPDRDSDGLDDLLVGAPGAGAARAGEAYIFTSVGGSVLGFFEGTAGNERFGESVAASFDGRVVVGAPRYGTEGNADRGRIAVYDAFNLLRWAYEGGAAGDRFGQSLAVSHFLPGVDYPGESYLFVGVPGADRTNFNQPTLEDRGGVMYSALAQLSFVSWLSGPDVASARFGERLAVVGDLDGDGTSDVGVLAPGVGVAGESYFFGLRDRNVQSFGFLTTGRENIETGVNVLPGAPGLALGGVGDINHDGFTDVLVSDGSHTAEIYAGYAIGGRLPISGASPDLAYAWADDAGPRQYLIHDGVIRAFDVIPEFSGETDIEAIANDGTIAFRTRPNGTFAWSELMFRRDGIVRPLSFLIDRIDGIVPDLQVLTLVRLHDGYRMLLGGWGTYVLLDGVLTRAEAISGVDMNSSGVVVGRGVVNGVSRSITWSLGGGVTVLEGMENAGRIREDGAVAGVVAGTTGFLDPGELALWQNGVLTDLGVGIFNVYTSTEAARWVFRGFDARGRILADVVTNSYRGPQNFTTYLFEPGTGLRSINDATHGAGGTIGSWSSWGTGHVPVTLLAGDGRIVVSDAVLAEVSDDAPYVLRSDSPTVSLSAADGDFIAGISQYNELVLFRRLGMAWERQRLTLELVTSANDNLVMFHNPLDGTSYLVIADRGRMDMYRLGLESISSFDIHWGNRPEWQYLIVDSLSVLVSTSGTINLVGTAPNGDLVLYFNQPGQPIMTPAVWTFDNITQTHLAARGLETPQFVSNLATFATAWNTMHIAGIDASGQVQVVWWAPDSPLWRLDNLTSNAIDARTMVGRISAFVTPWSTMHINGTDERGEAVALWWAPGFGGNWRVDQLITNPTPTTPRLAPASITSYVTSWGGLNVVGRDRATGRAVAYWWSPEAGRWTAEVLVERGDTPSPALAGVLSAGEGRGSELHVAARTAEGHVVRYAWSPGDGGGWSLDDLTARL